jgi:hypothetical protein
VTIDGKTISLNRSEVETTTHLTHLYYWLAIGDAHTVNDYAKASDLTRKFSEG